MANFVVPHGAVADVHIIDSGARLAGLKTSIMMSPEVAGFEVFPDLASYALLVTSSTGKRALFDLGLPIDAAGYPPVIGQMFNQMGATLSGTSTVPDTLEENGYDLKDISSVVWSHHHFDHTGNIRVFSPSTELVVGPGFSSTYLPGYPTVADSQVHDEYLNNRTLREVDFHGKDTIMIGSFRALDFFGDGSFYLLDTPGHTTGHLAGLARTTTSPDTFILMGGDLSHHAGEIRPSANLPIPDNVHPYLCPTGTRKTTLCCLQGQTFRQLQVQNGRKDDDAFFDAVFVEDEAAAAQTIDGAKTLDTEANVFIVLAHDMTLEGVIDFFPKPANDWKSKGWKETTRWSFLSDLATAAAESEKKTPGPGDHA